MSIQPSDAPSHERTKKPSPAEIYESYLVPGIHARWTPVFLDLARPQPGERVLDVACGTGIVAQNAAPAVGEDGAVTAVDVSPEMLDVARNKPSTDGAHIDWQQGDACDLAFTDDAFDLVLCQQGFQFLDDPASAAHEMHRVTKPDGRAAVSVWRDLDHHPLYAALAHAEADYLDRPVELLSRPFSMGDANELQEIFDAAGFERVEIVERSHEVRFPSPAKFTTFTLLAAASIIPESEMDADDRAAMVRSISSDVEPALQQHIDGDDVAFPMHAHVVVARA